jgi:predicted permease
VLCAFGGVRLFRALATNLGRVDLGSLGDLFPRLDAIGIDTTVMAFVVVTSLAAGVAFGLLPALRCARAREMDILRGTAGAAVAAPVSGGRITTQGVLVVVELAVATVLAVGGGLLIHSFAKLASVDTGYNAANVLTFQVGLPGTAGRPGTDRPAPELKKFADDLTARITSIPDVLGAGYANQLPLVKLQNSMQLSRTPIGPATSVSPESGGDVQLVSRDYLRVIGARVIAGRSFNGTDGTGSPQVLLINRTMAARDFPDRSPVGEFMYAGRTAAPWEVVGVVDDMLTLGLDRDPFPQFFLSLDQFNSGREVPLFPAGAYYAVRTANPRLVMPQIAAIVRQMESRASIENVATMNEIISNDMSRPRMYAVLLGILAGVAVLLAAAGIYGVMAYGVAQRTREIGIRMALGARRSEVLGLVLKQSAALTAIGITLGLAGAMLTTRYLQSLLFGLTPLDTETFAAAAGLFTAVATLAAYVPARRATKVDPLIALRAE